MYVDFFGLRREPFTDSLDPQLYVDLPPHQEALAMLESVMRGDRGVVCLTGDEGTGKSMLLRVFLDRLHTSELGVILSMQDALVPNIMRDFCRGLDISVSETDAPSRALAKLRRRLSADDRLGRQVVLVIDNAHHLREPDLSLLQPMVSLQGEQGSLLTTIFCGTRALVERLSCMNAGASAGNPPRRCTLPSLTRSDARRYLIERMRAAGAPVENVFSEEAHDLFHAATDGVPRRLNRIADAALRAAVRADKNVIDRELALEVAGGQVIKSRSLPAAAIACETTDAPAGVSIVDACAQQLREDRAAESPSHQTTETVSITLSTMGTAARSGVSDPQTTRFEPGNSEPTSIVAGSAPFTAPAKGAADTTGAGLGDSDSLLMRLEELVERATSPAGPLPLPITANTDRAPRARPHSAQRRRRWSRAMESRLERLIDLAEQRIQLLEERAQRIGESAPALEDQAQRVESACERAARVETRLASFGEQLARQAARVQDGFAMAAPDLEAISQLQTGLHEDIARAVDTRETLDHRLTAVKELFERLDARLAEDANRQQQQERNAEKLREGMDAASKQLEQLRHQVQASAEHQITLLEEAVTRARQSRAQIADDALTAVKAEADRVSDELSRRAEESTQTAQQAVRELHNQSLHATMIVETATARFQKDLDQRSAQAGQRQQQVIDEALACLQPLLAEVGAQQQKLADLREVTLRAEHTCESLSGSTAEAQQCQQALRHDRRAAEEARDALLSIHVQAQEKSAALVAQVDTAARTSDQLAERHDAARRLAEDLEQAARTHSEQADRAAHGAADLDRQMATAAETLQRISSQCEAARHLADLLERYAHAQVERMTEAAQSESTLKTRVAEAVQAERHLLDAHAQTHALNDAMAQSLRRGEEHVARVEKLLAALQAEAASANRLRQELAEADAAHPRRIEELQSAALAQQKQVERAAVLLQTLHEVLPAAQGAIAQWSACRGQADEVLTQLHSAVPTVKEAVEALVQRGEMAESHLARAVEQAHQTAGELERWSGDAARLREETQRHMRLVSEKNADDHRKLDDAALRLASFEESLRQATRQPHDILRQAAAQAEQLEHVCAAVRKVFAGISQATLQARQDVQRLDQQRSHATDTLAQLQNATERNVETLQQWIEEAARAQSRLATTLRQVPPISATHPPVSLPRSARARDVEPSTGASPGRRDTQSVMATGSRLGAPQGSAVHAGEPRARSPLREASRAARAVPPASTARMDFSDASAAHTPAEPRRASHVPAPREVADLIEDARLANEQATSATDSADRPHPHSGGAGVPAHADWESALAAVRNEHPR